MTSEITSDKTKNLDINDYFELYYKNKINYDRSYHTKNICNYDVSTVTDSLVKKIFTYIDQVIFNSKLTNYISTNNVDFKITVSKALTATAGFFFYKKNGKMMGFTISHVFFQNIIDKNIINVELGVLDENDKKYLSVNPIEPLLVTMEHEIIHMLMFITKTHKLNDLHTVKSGHTPVFKKLLYNIFRHYKITHGFSIGDVTINNAIKNTLGIGDYVKYSNKDIEGYIVNMKDKYATIYSNKNNKITYTNAFYKDIDVAKSPNEKIDVKAFIDKLQPDSMINICGKTYKITKVNKSSIYGAMSNKIFRIPKFRILEMTFMD